MLAVYNVCFFVFIFGHRAHIHTRQIHMISLLGWNNIDEISFSIGIIDKAADSLYSIHFGFSSIITKILPKQYSKISFEFGTGLKCSIWMFSLLPIRYKQKRRISDGKKIDYHWRKYCVLKLNWDHTDTHDLNILVGYYFIYHSNLYGCTLYTSQSWNSWTCIMRIQ